MSYGPYIPPAKIMFVGQAPADEELRKGEPLVGPAGKEFTRLTRQAGIDRCECAITNVFDFRIEGNEVERLCVKSTELKAALKEIRIAERKGTEIQPELEDFRGYALPPIKQRSLYLRPDFAPSLDRLASEIWAANPNIIVALGDEALWALTGENGIKAHRGSVRYADAPWLDRPRKMLATYHPSYVLRQYKERFTVLADLLRARKESEFPEVRRPTRELWLDPSIEDIRVFKREFLDPADLISLDIETAKGTITEISFAPSPNLSLIVPFAERRDPWRRRHWRTHAEEVEAVKLVRDICQSRVPKLCQNGLYDVTWLWRLWKIKTRNYREDTRLLHHALFPEMPKSLEYMGSVWEDEAAWKQLRAGAAEKRDD